MAASADDLYRESIKTALCDAILKAVNGPERDAILTSAVKQWLGEWQLKRAVEELVAVRAKQLAAELLNRGDFDAEICQALEAGFKEVLTGLPAAVAKTVRDALFGVEGKDSYSTRCGLVLRNL
jgi:hypothetical protein